MSLTWVGKVAPPIPTMPAARIRSRSSSAVSFAGSAPASPSTQASSPSGRITTAGSARPEGCGRGSTATTSPEVEACTGTETKPLAVPTTSPFLTFSPTVRRPLPARRCAGRGGSPAPRAGGRFDRLVGRPLFIVRRMQAAGEALEFHHSRYPERNLAGRDGSVDRPDRSDRSDLMQGPKPWLNAT